MDVQTRKALTQALQKHVGAISHDLRAKFLVPGDAQGRARALHAQEKVGDDFTVWTDLLSRRAAVLWVLKTVYVRVLEDRGMLAPKRLADGTSWALFGHLAPNLGHSAYLRWVFKDLASARGGIPELFSLQAAEVAEPSDSVSKALIDFWQAKDEATGQSRWRFDDEHFDGRLMGDLYQDLDPVVKARFALLQTPDFVLEFILDRTLTPAIEEFGIDQVRVLDPACGSGHFLIATLKRLVEGMRAKFPERPAAEVVAHCLDRVVGIDLNDYACALARARMVMTASELAEECDLAAASVFHPKVFWADGLDQVEREQEVQTDLFTEVKPTAVLTRPEVRARLRPELDKRFHAIVANPPYITEKDPTRRNYHREKVGKTPRYISAVRTYSLGAPFTERMFQLAVPGGYVGQITANSFMKREFGSVLIEKVLPREDLFLIIDTSGAYIPGHGTPTVLLFGRHRKPEGDSVRVVMGKRGEPGAPTDPTRGKVWTSIVEGWEKEGFENEFASVAAVTRKTLTAHPWSIGGGGAAELMDFLRCERPPLESTAPDIGFGAVTREDGAYVRGARSARRSGVSPDEIIHLVEGEQVRDWAIGGSANALFPYRWSNSELQAEAGVALERALWPLKASLRNRPAYGQTQLERGLSWFEYSMLFSRRMKVPLSITFAEVATHNHFVLDRGGKVFKQTAPVIKLPATASEAEHLALLAQLNSSTAEFWMKQVYQPKGGDKVGGEGARVAGERWEERFQRDGTKLQSFPLATLRDDVLETFAAAADATARARPTAASVVSNFAKQGALALRKALDTRRETDLLSLRRLVALQEELDWYVYKLYGLAPEVEIRLLDAVTPLTPGERPFELTLAQEDAERRASLARGEEPDEAPTEWFIRHGWAPVTSIDLVPPEHRRVIEQRLELTQASRFLSLIEQATFKHRWYLPEYAKEEKAALEQFLCDRMEDFAEHRQEPFTLKQLVAALQEEPAVIAVAELLSDGQTLDLEALIATHLVRESVPNPKHHVFKAEGLKKRAVWEKTWAMQHEEDRQRQAHPDRKPTVQPPVPPKYATADYLRGEYWTHRGALDVPKERFIAFTEVPQVDATETPYGWAGWTHLERAKHLVAFYEAAVNAGTSKEERIGLLHALHFLLPYVAWESPDAEEEFRAIVTSAVGTSGVTEEQLEQWAAAHPPPSATRKKKAKKGKAT